MKKYALIKMTTLRVHEFDSKEELKDAVGALKQNGIDVIVLKRVPELGNYTQLEIY